MSTNNRTKGARSQKKAGFDQNLLNGGASRSADAPLSSLASNIVQNYVQIHDKYEVSSDPPQREIVLKNIENDLKNLIPARRWEYKKWWLFVFCTVSALFGAGGCLWALGKTVLFADQRPSMLRLGLVCIFFIPFFVWVKIVFLPHGQTRIELDEMTELRAERRRMDNLRYLHLEGRLARPEKEVEIPDAPYEYRPEEPWLYIRWRPKPKQYYYIDEENVAHKALHGSVEEEKEIAKEQWLKDIMNEGNAGGNLAEAAMRAMAKGDDEEDLDEEEVRKSTVRQSSVSDV